MGQSLACTVHNCTPNKSFFTAVFSMEIYERQGYFNNPKTMDTLDQGFLNCGTRPPWGCKRFARGA